MCRPQWTRWRCPLSLNYQAVAAWATRRNAHTVTTADKMGKARRYRIAASILRRQSTEYNSLLLIVAFPAQSQFIFPPDWPANLTLVFSPELNKIMNCSLGVMSSTQLLCNGCSSPSHVQSGSIFPRRCSQVWLTIMFDIMVRESYRSSHCFGSTTRPSDDHKVYSSWM